MTGPRTLLDKIWDAHIVAPPTPDTPAIVYIDLHLIHEVTSPQAFAELKARGLRVRRPDRTVATVDHAIPTDAGRARSADGIRDPQAARQVRALEDNCREAGIHLHGLDSPHQGIVHVIGPELGLTLPGTTIVCGDSHTSTHGAFGALAFGIGTSEVGHVLATQCLLLEKPKAMALTLRGRPAPGVTAKDIILGVIAKFGASMGLGHVIEFRGDTVATLSMDERMTLCNMAVEAGARSGIVAPDEVTLSYLAGRPGAPTGVEWDRAVRRYADLRSDEGAVFDAEREFDVASLEPRVTYGTSPGLGVAVSGTLPSGTATASESRSFEYMGLAPGQRIEGQPIDVVFIGSCTNGRLSDLRQAARIFDGRRVASGVRVLIVPGSQAVKRQAEEEGLDRIFAAAGAEWREAGCSMCLAMNEDRLTPGQFAVSTSNRNFEGRQGPHGRTLLASPLTAAASAIKGHVADPREFLR